MVCGLKETTAAGTQFITYLLYVFLQSRLVFSNNIITHGYYSLMTKKQTGQVSVKSLKLNKKSTKPCFWLTKDERIALFKENPNPTFIIGNLLKIQKNIFIA